MKIFQIALPAVSLFTNNGNAMLSKIFLCHVVFLLYINEGRCGLLRHIHHHWLLPAIISHHLRPPWPPKSKECASQENQEEAETNYCSSTKAGLLLRMDLEILEAGANTVERENLELERAGSASFL